MLDPYAPLVSTLPLPEGVHLVSRAGKAASKPQNKPALLGSLAYLQDAFDWGEDRLPNTPLVDSIILEVDVPTFSTDDSSVPAEHRGALVLEWCHLCLAAYTAAWPVIRCRAASLALASLMPLQRACRACIVHTWGPAILHHNVHACAVQRCLHLKQASRTEQCIYRWPLQPDKK